MKKFLITIVSLSLAICFAFSAIGCSGVSTLSFSNSFNGGSEPNSLTETLIYDVELVDNYNNKIQKAQSFPDEVVKYGYTNGKYTVKLTVAPFIDNSEIKTKSGIEFDANIYHLHTEFSIDVSYEIKNKDKYENTDSIITDTYFYPAGQSFAPMYSSTHSKQSFLSISSSEAVTASVSFNESQTEIVYNQDKYTITTDNKSTEGKDSIKTVTYNYDLKSVIDNTQLLFALRNMNLTENVTSSLPTVAPAYGEAKKLSISLVDSVNQLAEVSYNGGEPSSEIPVKNIKFNIQSNTNSGAYQYVSIQTGAVKNGQTDLIPNRSLIVKYATPHVAFGSFLSMGAFVYTLKTVTVE